MSRFSIIIILINILFTITACNIWFEERQSPTLEGQRISIITHKRGVKVVEPIQITLPEPRYNRNWPQTGGCSQHVMQHLEATPSVIQVFSNANNSNINLHRRVLVSPIVADGQIYVADGQATIAAFDTRSGSGLWEKKLLPLNEEIDPVPIGGLAYDNGLLFVTTAWGTIVALQANTGLEMWRNFVGAPIRAAPTVSGQRVFILNKKNEIRAFAEDNGVELWRWQGLTETTTLLGGSALTVDGNTVIAALTSGELVALRAENGKQVWSVTLEGSGSSYTDTVSNLSDIIVPPIVSRGRVYVVSSDGVIAAVDVHSGEQLWELELSSTQQPWLSGNFLFILTKDGNLVSLEVQGGHTAWITELPRWENTKDSRGHIYWSGPVLVNNQLIIVGSHRRVASFSPYTGLLINEYTLQEKVIFSPIVADRTLYLISDNGTVISYR